MLQKNSTAANNGANKMPNKGMTPADARPIAPDEAKAGFGASGRAEIQRNTPFTVRGAAAVIG